MHQKTVTVSIVNWNTCDELRHCLESVFSQEVDGGFDVVVVDNGSRDGSLEMLSNEYRERLTLISNKKNVGFGAAHNQAMTYASGKYVLLLNPDCRLLGKDVLQKMSDFMASVSCVGVIGPQIRNPDGSLQYSTRKFPTLLAALFRHTPFGRLFPNNPFVRDYLMTDWSHDEPKSVDWVSGAAMMIKWDTIEEIGLLDTRFFMYCEDIDICKRAKDYGWKVMYFPEAMVSHRIGAASDRDPITAIRRHHRSMFKYYMKHNWKSPKILLTPLLVAALWLRMRSRIKVAKMSLEEHNSSD